MACKADVVYVQDSSIAGNPDHRLITFTVEVSCRSTGSFTMVYETTDPKNGSVVLHKRSALGWLGTESGLFFELKEMVPTGGTGMRFRYKDTTEVRCTCV